MREKEIKEKIGEENWLRFLDRSVGLSILYCMKLY